MTHIGIGSNLGDRIEHINLALTELDGLAGTRVLQRSSLYETEPVGESRQPEFLNAVALLKTALTPLVLLSHLQTIECHHGRVRRRKWGPRTLDLDVLLWGSKSIKHPRLQVPHPFLHLRAFVLIPLAEMDAQLQIPGHGNVTRLLARLGQTSTRNSTGSVRRLDET